MLTARASSPPQPGDRVHVGEACCSQERREMRNRTVRPCHRRSHSAVLGIGWLRPAPFSDCIAAKHTGARGLHPGRGPKTWTRRRSPRALRSAVATISDSRVGPAQASSVSVWGGLQPFGQLSAPSLFPSRSWFPPWLWLPLPSSSQLTRRMPWLPGPR